MVASRKTLDPAGISDSGFAPSAVKQPFLFGEQLPNLPGRQFENAPALRHDPFRPGGNCLAVEVPGQSIAHHVRDLPALADRLVAGPVVKAFVEQCAELPAHDIMTVS